MFNSDEEAKRLYDRDDIREAMKARFGEDVYFDDNQVNRKRVAEIIFNDDKAMHDVEQMLYPALNAWFDEWAEQQEAPYVLYESAIIFEKGLADMSAQWTENEKRENADYIIEHDNDDEDDYLLEQVMNIHEDLLPSRKFHFFSKK